MDDRTKIVRSGDRATLIRSVWPSNQLWNLDGLCFHDRLRIRNRHIERSRLLPILIDRVPNARDQTQECDYPEHFGHAYPFAIRDLEATPSYQHDESSCKSDSPRAIELWPASENGRILNPNRRNRFSRGLRYEPIA